jgi:hypothetical protein
VVVGELDGLVVGVGGGVGVFVIVGDVVELVVELGDGVGVGGGVGVFVIVGDVVELVVGLEDDVELGDGVGVEGFDKIQSLLLSIVQL